MQRERTPRCALAEPPSELAFRECSDLVFSMLSTIDLHRVRRVSREWRSLASRSVCTPTIRITVNDLALRRHAMVDRDLQRILKGAAGHLQVLELSWVQTISAPGFAPLASMQTLQECSVIGCQRVSALELARLLKRSSVRSVSFRDCRCEPADMAELAQMPFEHDLRLCPVCDSVGAESYLCTADDCGLMLCEGCDFRSCDGCDALLCNGCSDGTGAWCEAGCSTWFCDSCQEDDRIFDCAGCGFVCHDCGGKPWECEACGAQACDGCVTNPNLGRMCGDCGTWTCGGCVPTLACSVYECMGCYEMVCNDCQPPTTCIGCKATFCNDCKVRDPPRTVARTPSTSAATSQAIGSSCAECTAEPTCQPVADGVTLAAGMMRCIIS